MPFNQQTFEGASNDELETIAAKGSKSPPLDSVSVGVAAGQVFAANANRKSALFVNMGAATVYLGRDNTVTTANGVPLAPATGTAPNITPGGSLTDISSTDAWWAISGLAAQDLRVLEIS